MRSCEDIAWIEWLFEEEFLEIRFYSAWYYFATQFID